MQEIRDWPICRRWVCCRMLIKGITYKIRFTRSSGFSRELPMFAGKAAPAGLVKETGIPVCTTLVQNA